ncbi:MAG: hypothetical protein H2184_14255 [Candidatus Galacturonibacter soehngenii]|nr:hypothetical protein [Candidatus Galacturonibacter soehngenii]
MKYIKFILCAISSFVLSHWLFNGSTLVTLLILGLLDIFMQLTKNSYTVHQKEKWYRITLIICLFGGLLIGLGSRIFISDVVKIGGMLIFIPTLAVLLLKEIYVLVKYVLS